jgi:hypothetical protein
MSNNEFSEKFPFLTGIKYMQAEHVGIVVNSDNQLLSFYDIDSVHGVEQKRLLLELGDEWWWGSNRQLPIDVFLRTEMKPFRYCLKTFMMKDVEILFGPTVSLQDLIKKRIKRRSIQLVRKTDD